MSDEQDSADLSEYDYDKVPVFNPFGDLVESIKQYIAEHDLQPGDTIMSAEGPIGFVRKDGQAVLGENIIGYVNGVRLDIKLDDPK